MSSKVEIFSQASIAIGQGRQQDANEDNAFCNSANDIYDNLRLSALSSHRWGFNRAREQMSQLATKTQDVDEWQYAYKIPSKAIAVYRVYPSSDYTIYQDEIYSNHSELWAGMLIDVSEGEFPSTFTRALALQIASDLCYQITDNARLNELTEVKANKAWLTAWTVDAQQRPTEDVEDEPLIWVRNA